MKPIITYEIAMAAAKDAATRHMRKENRNVWNKDDYEVAVDTFNNLFPLEKTSNSI